MALVTDAMACMSTPPGRSMVTRSTGPACSRSNSSTPSDATTGSTTPLTRSDTLTLLDLLS